MLSTLGSITYICLWIDLFELNPKEGRKVWKWVGSLLSLSFRLETSLSFVLVNRFSR